MLVLMTLNPPSWGRHRSNDFHIVKSMHFQDVCESQFHMWILSNSNCVQLVVYLFQMEQLVHCDELISACMKRHLSTIRSLSDAFTPIL